MEIRNLIIETTRRCNMKCQHCLRGAVQNMDMETKYIDSLLSQFRSIGNVTFSGGEPSLNVPIMEYFLSECKRRNVYVGSFYVATNGLKPSIDFTVFCLKMFAFCSDKEMCRVDLSNDMYHAEEGNFNTELLDGLSFFGKKFENDNFRYTYGLLNEGRAKKLTYLELNEVHESKIESLEDLEEADIYLNCKGEIINGCDWPYASQSKHKLCDVSELYAYYEKIEQLELVEA